MKDFKRNKRKFPKLLKTKKKDNFARKHLDIRFQVQVRNFYYTFVNAKINSLENPMWP